MAKATTTTRATMTTTLLVLSAFLAFSTSRFSATATAAVMAEEEEDEEGGVASIGGRSGASGSSGELLKIAAFNIQNLGQKKVDNAEVLKVIVKILSRYDVVLVQEIVDKDEKAILKLMAALNRSKPSKSKYSHVVGPRVGRTFAKEQYAYIYKQSKLKLVKSYTYPDDDADDVFEREPFVAIFQPTSKTELGDFALVGIHTKPTDAVRELQHLHLVAEDVAQTDTENIIVMGDFNADCDYVRKKWWKTIPLRTDTSRYTWLIGDEVDTTSGHTHCTYDRIVVTGDELESSVVVGSAKAYEFDAAYKLNATFAKAVSDHYPVEAKIRLASGSGRRTISSSLIDDANNDGESAASAAVAA